MTNPMDMVVAEYEARIAALKAENAMLTTRLEVRSQSVDVWAHAKLQEENARLREALEEIYATPTDIKRAVEIARKALGRKE